MIRPRWVARIAAVVILGVVLGACGATRPEPLVTFPPATFGAGSVTTATDATRQAIDRVLGQIGLTARPAQSPYRPGESPLFTAAPRIVLEVQFPGGDAVVPISIYEFTNDDAADAAGSEQARYVSSPVGRVLFPAGTQFTVRRDGRTVVFYGWLSSDDQPRTAEVATALAGVGAEIQVPG